MMRKRCQATRYSLYFAILALSSVIWSPISARPVETRDPAVLAAIKFFDGLDQGDLRAVREIASDEVYEHFMSAGQLRRQRFGARWAGDRGIREVIGVEKDNQGAIVTLRAKYEAATLDQIAFVICSDTCRVTAFKEGPPGD